MGRHHHARRVISIHALREEGDLFLHIPGGRVPDFNPRPPRGGRLGGEDMADYAFNFNPRPPRGGRRRGQEMSQRKAKISIHALREEGDQGRKSPCCPHRRFQSTPSARRATAHQYLARNDDGFQSTPSARRATRRRRSEALGGIISIHALREEGDPAAVTVVRVHVISIHALREEGDVVPHASNLAAILFQSTPSARRATHRGAVCIGDLGKFQSTPSARRATVGYGFLMSQILISIHALREEGDGGGGGPGGGVDISIHALREEGDPFRSSRLGAPFDFNPRPPRGGRPWRTWSMVLLSIFQSTPSARRATVVRLCWLLVTS